MEIKDNLSNKLRSRFSQHKTNFKQYNLNIMQIEINVVHSLSAETVTLLERLLGKPAVAATPSPISERLATEKEQATTKLVKKAGGKAVSDTPAVEAPAPAVSAAPDADVTGEITAEFIRSKVQEVSVAGKREQAKALMTSFGAASVSLIPKDRYKEFLTELNAL